MIGTNNKLIIAVLFLFVPIVTLGQDSQSTQLTVKDIHGRHIRLSDYRGKVVLVNFWATWCPPCRTEIPDLIKLQRDYRSKDLQVIGVTSAKTRGSAPIRSKSKGELSCRSWHQRNEVVFTTSETLPMTIVIGKDGRIRDIIEGILLPEEFEQKIKPLLK